MSDMSAEEVLAAQTAALRYLVIRLLAERFAVRTETEADAFAQSILVTMPDEPLMAAVEETVNSAIAEAIELARAARAGRPQEPMPG